MIKYKEIAGRVGGFIKSKIHIIIIAVLLIFIGKIVFEDESFKEVMPDTIAEAPLLKPVAVKAPEKKAEVCMDNKYVVSADTLLDTSNMIILDLNTFELFKTKRIDNKRMGYYYRRKGALQEYYTVFKDEPLEQEKKEFVKLHK